MRKIVPAIVALICGAAVWMLLAPGGNSRRRAEREHGIRLPRSADHIQCRGDAWHGFLDRGAATVFEMKTNDLAPFVSELQVRSRTAPMLTIGDPPLTVGMFGRRTPLRSSREMMNMEVSSILGVETPRRGDVELLVPKGDWLHVEIWRLQGDAMVVKMYTDWN